MVGSVNLAVAIQALASQHLGRCALWRNAGSAVSDARMVPGVVALLAQPGASTVEQWRVIRAVCLVADAAVLAHRLVLPQEGAAFLGVALVAGFVEGVVNQAGFTCRAVRFVAIGAGHQASV